MPAKNLTLAGKRFVILPEAEYRQLRKRAGIVRNSRRQVTQDQRDTAEALRRLNDPADKVVSYADARKRLGVK
jgi:hypothetical protein